MERKIVVSKKEDGDFKTIQEAVNSIPDNNQEKIIIFVKSGKYYEKLIIWGNKTNITMIGEDRENTIIEFDDYALKLDEEGQPYRTYRTSSVRVDADNFKVKNITFINSAGPGEEVGQAVAVQVLGDRCIFRECTFLAYQDTFYTKAESARIYVKDCFIEGDIDFIFGASIAVFEECVISSIHKSGFISAASTPIERKYGYLFEKCQLISNLPEKTVYLGRPWHPAGDPNAVASVVFKECMLGEHIKNEGWTEMKGFRAEDARLFEYKNNGPGAVENIIRRQLSDKEALEYTPEKMLSGEEKWEFRKFF